MTFRALLVLTVLLPTVAWAEERPVKIKGTDVTFPVKVTRKAKDGQVTNLVLTGAALRTKMWVKVYAVGSYLESGAKVRVAKQLIRLDGHKELHLIMVREIGGQLMAQAMRDALKANFPGKFARELVSVERYLRGKKAKKGEAILLVHRPKKGLRISIGKHAPLDIKGLPFARAVWDMYLGKKPVTEEIKKALISRLRRRTF